MMAAKPNERRMRLFVSGLVAGLAFGLLLAEIPLAQAEGEVGLPAWKRCRVVHNAAAG